MRQDRAILAIGVAIVVAIAGVAAVIVLSGPPPSVPPTILPPGTSAVTCVTAAGVSNWTTYHGDATRTGGYLSGASITHVTPAWGGPVTLDAQIYAEPLTCGNSVYVVTENNSVYALNASTGAVEWRVGLGTPMPGSALPCGDIDPSGITGTPVIDRSTGTLFVVAFVQPGHHELFSLNVSNGHLLGEANVDPPGVSPLVEQQRGALALDGKVVEVPFGGLDGDCGQYDGAVVGESTSFTGTPLSYLVPTLREAGIWSVGGVVVAPNGSLFVSTGNGASTTTFDFGDSVIELSPTLAETDFFAPTNWAQLNQDDTDLGSVTPTLLPNGDLFQIGKAGVGDLLLARHLGGIGGQLYESGVCGGAYGATAHVGNEVYVPCTDGLYAVDATATNFTVAWQSTSFDSGSPIVTGDVVWAVDVGSAALLGFNWSTGAPLFTFPLGAVDHFISPAAGANAVYVGAGDQLYGFRLG